MTAAPRPPNPERSPLARVGLIGAAVARHVLTRGALWAGIGFGLAVAVLLISVGLSVATFGRASMLMASPPFIAVLGAVVVGGVGLFAAHGLQRGVARAALDLAHELALVRHVTDRLLELVAARLPDSGGRLSRPALLVSVRGAITTWARTGAGEGRGLRGWILRRARRVLVGAVGGELLDELGREDLGAGDGGGAVLARVGDRVAARLEGRLGDAIMAPLNSQRTLLLVGYLVLGSSWFHITFYVLAFVAGRVTRGQ